VSRPIEAISPSILGSAWRFRRIVVICAVIGVLGAYLFTALSQPEYAATAGIALAPPPASVTTPSTGTSDVSPTEYQQEQFALIDSTSVAQAAARTVRKRMPSSHLTGTALKAAESVQGPPDGPADSTAATSSVTVTLPNADEAAEAADAIVAAYIEAFHSQIVAEAAESESELDTQIKTVTKQLKTLTPAERTQTTSPSSTSSTTTTTTQAQTSAATSALSFGAALADTTTTTTSSSSTTTTSSSTTTTTTSTTSTTTTTTTTTATTTTTTVPASTTTTSAPTTTTLPATTTTTTAPPSVSAQAQRTALTSTLAALTREKSAILVNRAIDLEYNPPYVPATVPTAPVGNDMVFDLTIGALAGLVLGFLFAFLLASSRRRFDNPRQPSYVYGARLLATVPAFVVEEWTEVALPLITDPTGEAAEGYRTLATALRAFRATSGSLVVAVTAGDLGAGTTTVTSNVGCALAEMGEKTVVLDTDTLGRSVTRALLPASEHSGLPEVQPGLSDLIDGRPLEETVMPSTLVHGLWVVPSGRDYTMAMHRWKAARMRSVLEQVAAQFDVVLIDTPPVGMTSYALDVVAAAGQAVLVVPHHDSVRLHEQLADRLTLTNAELVGYLYNGKPLDLEFSAYYPVVPTTAHVAKPGGGGPDGGHGHVGVTDEGAEVAGSSIGAEGGASDHVYGERDPAPASPASGRTMPEPPLGPTGKTAPTGPAALEPSQPGGREDDTLAVDAIRSAPEVTDPLRRRRSWGWRRRGPILEDRASIPEDRTSEFGGVGKWVRATPADDTLVLPPRGAVGGGQRLFGPESRLPWRRRAEGHGGQMHRPGVVDG
jgi:Mrp family chromosome partitioning ATPase